MSDEAARRRELRKQRILGNSENRLKRILNKDDQALPTDQDILNGDSKLSDDPPKTTENSDSVPQIPNRTTNPLLHTRTPLISDFVNDLDTPMPFPDFASMGLFGSDPNQDVDLSSSRSVLDVADLENLGNASDPMELLCRLAASLEGAKSDPASSVQQVSYQGPAFLVDSGNTLRIRFIFLLGILSRLLLPSLPVEYAKLFGPLYLVEILLFSLCFVYKAPLEHSSMSLAYSLMSLFGFHSIFVKVMKIFSSAFELVLRDMWSYSFSFFITHALCQQFEVLEV